MIFELSDGMSQPKRLFLFKISYIHTKVLTVAQCPGNFIAKMSNNHNDISNTQTLHVFDEIFYQGGITYGENGFRKFRAEGFHSSPFAGRKDDAQRIKEIIAALDRQGRQDLL